MLAVSTRLAFHDRLIRVSERFELPVPHFFPSTRRLLESGARGPLLFIDLPSCCDDVGLEGSLQGWRDGNPLSEIVLFAPLLDRDRETRLIFRLATLGAGRVMTESDFGRPEVWRTLNEAQVRASLKDEIQTEFMAAIAATGRRLRAEQIVLSLLREAPAVIDVNDSVGAAFREYHRANAEASRKAIWLKLRRADQMPVSWLLLTFRLLWHSKLQQKGWPTSQIAPFMSFRSGRDFRRALRRRAGISMRELKTVKYEDALAWAARVSTGGYAELASGSVSGMIEPLFAQARSRASNAKP